MRTIRLIPTIRALGLVAMLGTCSLAAVAQLIPASSADSGRRAVIAVNQGTIYNNINNAQNSANNAWNYANGAQNTANVAYNAANNAQYTANVANNAAGNAQAGADGARGLAEAAYRRAEDGGAGMMVGMPIDVSGSNLGMFSAWFRVPNDQNALAGALRVACFKGAAGPGSVPGLQCPPGANLVALSYTPGVYFDGGHGGE